MRKIINFIKYNNAFTIIIALIFFSAGGALANEKVRDTVIGQTIITKNGTDNTQIISANLDNFDMGLRIKSVKEDDKFYYVDFDYKTIDAIDGIWKEIIKEKNMYVSKASLRDMDLGVYLAEELSQLTAKEMAYMKEVQSIEKNKGEQKQTESVEYTGLKGLVFNNETKELAGYKPVKEEKEDKTIVINAAALAAKAIDGDKQNDSAGASADAEKTGPQVTVVKEVLSKETIMKMVKEALAQEKSGINLSNASTTDTISSASSTAISSSSSAVSGGGGNQVESSSSSSGGSSSSSSAAVSSSSISSASSASSLSSSSSSSSADSSASSSSSSAISSSSSSLEAASSSVSISSSSSAVSSAGSSSYISSSSSESAASSASSVSFSASSTSSSISSPSSPVATSSGQSSESSSTVSSSSSSSSAASESSSPAYSGSSSQPSL